MPEPPKYHISPKEKEIIHTLNHSMYTVKFLEQWINRNDNVMINAPAAMQACAAKSYYAAVKKIALKLENLEENSL